MTRKNKFIIFASASMLACLTTWPIDAAAQSGARPRGGNPPATGTVPATRQAVPRPPGSRPPTLNRRPYYRPYYRSYYRPYYGYYGGYYSPYYWGWGLGWGAGWGSWYGWGYQYPYPPYYYPGRYYYDPRADLRVEVKPREAEVYLDGYLVGTVDDFDGVFQRLQVPYGEHEVTIYSEGHQPIRHMMLFRPGESYRIKEVMQPVPEGAQPEPRPTPSRREAEPRDYPPARDYPPPRERAAPPPGPPAGPPDERAVQGDFGTLSIRVQPAGAEILVDGERWETPAGEDRLTLDLNEGTHRVEVRKEGFKPYTAEVPIRRGRTASLNVSLPKG